jgi:hypothetical protein
VNCPKITPEPAEFVVGYAACEVLFFGEGVTHDVDPAAVTNPFRAGTDQHRGFEAAFYDFTQK